MYAVVQLITSLKAIHHQRRIGLASAAIYIDTPSIPGKDLSSSLVMIFFSFQGNFL